MISALMFDDQDLPVGPERPGEDDFPIERGDDLRIRTRFKPETLRGISEIRRFAVAADKPPPHRQGQRSAFGKLT
jgi:hypothetical protein